jgi:hypothetical protein
MRGGWQAGANFYRVTVNNPKYLNMSDKELIAHIAVLAQNLLTWRDAGWGDAGYRLAELRDATKELDLRVNRS